VALPHLQDLLGSTREIVNLASLQGSEILYLERLSSHRAVTIPGRVAGRFPATCSGIGKAILAFSPKEVVVETLRQGLPRLTPYSIASPVLFLEALEQTRRRGLAVDNEESRLGLYCVAAPIFDHLGQPVAGVSVSGPPGRTSLATVGPAVTTTARAISRRLGYNPS
jgi:DNA-binding IclR family transcriptional regulator